MADETELVITGVGVPPYSARGLTQTYAPIAAAANLRRTINGALKDVAQLQFRKYVSSVNGDDQVPPAFDGIWPGLTVTVQWIAELSYPVGGSPGRTVVPDSEVTEEGFVRYRPQMNMKVTNFTVDKNEYGAQVGWTLELEEI